MRNKTINLIFSFLLLIGLYFPSSADGIINPNYERMMLFILLSVLSLLFFLNKEVRIGFWKKIRYSYAIMFIIVLFTFISAMRGYTQFFWGVLIQYSILSLLFLSNYSHIQLNNSTKNIFVLTNILNIILGFSIVLAIPAVQSFFYNHYSAFYPELLANMFFSNKPVVMFASHGLASAFYYLFFFMLFSSYTKCKSKLHLMLAFLNLVLLFYTKSTTSYVLLIAAVINITYFFYKNSRNKYLIVIPVITFCVLAITAISSSNLMPDFNSTNNGFMARYSEDGILKPTIEYIKNSPMPIGIAIIPGLFNADSGWLINILRGSIFLIIAVYAGLYSFLKTNIKRKTAIWLFLIFLALELGGLIMTYIRMMYVLPFFVVYMRNLYHENEKY